jgi:hypothetical protein
MTTPADWSLPAAILLDRIFTLNDIDPSWNGKCMEDLFHEDALAIQAQAYPSEKSLSKKFFNRAIQELLMSGSTSNLSDTTKSNFKKVFDFFCRKTEIPNREF